MHRGERARRSSAILELRAIWNILCRTSVIWAILTGVVRKAGKIKSTSVFSSQDKVHSIVLHALTDYKSEAVHSSVCDKLGANQSS